MRSRAVDTLNIVYAADHAYFLYCAISIHSLMDHLPQGQRVHVHLLCDESFCAQDQRMLDLLTARFPNLRVSCRWVAEEAFDERDFTDSLWSKAACYRLVLPKLLGDVDRCLYIDADTLVVGDLLPLWEMDMEGLYLAGVLDDIAPVRAQTVGDHVPGIQTYVNSGVLFMNLELMRADGVQDRLLARVADYMVVDQDLLNVECYGHIRLLPPGYNCIPGIRVDEPKILHFLMRDYLRPWKNRRARGAEQWWRYAQEFAGLCDLEALRAQADWYERGSASYLYRRCADYAQVYVIGSGPDAVRVHRALRLGRCKGLHGPLPEDKRIDYAPDALVICASNRRNVRALEAFLEHEDGARQVLRHERWPVSYYNLLPDEVSHEVEGELLMWEYGVDSRGVTVPSALLEICAVRHPNKEALVEWVDGTRASCTFNELNARANRMANWLRGRGIARGTMVRLPEGTRPTQALAAAMGILKAGCVVAQVGDAPVTAELSVLMDDRHSSKSPACEPVPYETALHEDGRTWTGRDLCEEAERLRRCCGWHGGDKPLVDVSVAWGGLIQLLAACARGCTTVLVAGNDPRMLLDVADREQASIMCMGKRLFLQTVDQLESVPSQQLATCRFAIVGDEVDADDPARLRWQQLVAHIPLDGQGFAGEFFYDSRWYT